ncbi:SRPBCC domain-containing protein [Fulvivirgaceae bacterium BMA10]|uniref:SRPBCC domain-containing protein n=1 Tax=Splendidivirga corallicola TaxID=3051826 RepID=A0ABT8KJT8_9BACT|nr:SRPBCC domain-containing protein [Fulvivirgaceae bacterium BMA10]
MKVSKVYFTKIEKEKLFEAWISSDMVIEPVSRIESDPVVGGQYKLYAESPTGTSVMSGEFKVIDKYERLEYTWHWEGTGEITVVNIAFKQVLDQTIVKLEHEGFATIESRDIHDAGWDNYFEGLERKLLNSI